MAYSETLAARVRQIIPPTVRVEEKKMMGGLTFMVNGKMCVGVAGNALMFRIDPADYETALAHPACRKMDFTGRPMSGFVFVDEAGLDTDQELIDWVGLALAFNDKAIPSRKHR